MENLETIIRDKIRETAFKQVGLEDELLSSGILTSILVVDLATSLEEALGISIPFTEITPEHFTSVQTIRAYLLLKMAGTV